MNTGGELDTVHYNGHNLSDIVSEVQSILGQGYWYVDVDKLATNYWKFSSMEELIDDFKDRHMDSDFDMDTFNRNRLDTGIQNTLSLKNRSHIEIYPSDEILERLIVSLYV